LIVGEAAAAAADPVTWVDHIRLLALEFEIETNSQDLFNRLAAVTQRAEQEVPVAQRGVVTVTWTGEEFRVRGDGIEDDFEFTATLAVETLYQRLHGRAIAALPDHIRINAASGMHAGGSFLIAGPPRAGKTTLAIGLMLARVDITGDALALLRHREALAFPRKFLAREDSLGQVPALRSIDRFAAGIGNPQEHRVVALDPLEFGKPWRIAPAPVSAIFWIEPNDGARSTVLRTGKIEMMQRLLPYCAAPVSGRRDWLGDLCATVDRAETFVIELGDLDSAVAATKQVLER
jgi:hypothetical protein